MRNLNDEINRSGKTPTRSDIKWTGAEIRQRDSDLRQFKKGDVYWITTDAYRDGWEQIFGSKPS